MLAMLSQAASPFVGCCAGCLDQASSAAASAWQPWPVVAYYVKAPVWQCHQKTSSGTALRVDGTMLQWACVMV